MSEFVVANATSWSNPRQTIARQEPRWGLAFLCVVTYLVIEYTRLAAVFPILQPFQLGKVVVVIGTIAYLLTPGEAVNNLQRKKVDRGLIFLAVVGLLSAVLAKYQAPTWPVYFDLIRWVILYFLFSRVLSSSWRSRTAALFLVLLNLKLAQFGIRTYFAGKAYGRTDEFMARGVGAGSTGFFSNSNDFGLAMCVVWPLAAYLVIGEKNRFMRVVLLVCFLVITAAIYISASRGAMVGMVLVSVLIWLKNPKKIVVPIVIGVLAGGGYLALPKAFKDRVSSGVNYEQDQNAQTRLRLWKAGIKMFADHPVLGVGPGNFGSYYEKGYAENDPNPQAWVPHSIYVQTLSELGLVGTVAFLFLTFQALRMTNQAAAVFKARDPAESAPFEYSLALGLRFSFFSFLISGAFLTVLYYPHFWILLGMTTGLHSVSCKRMACSKY